MVPDLAALLGEPQPGCPAWVVASQFYNSIPVEEFSVCFIFNELFAVLL